MRNSESLTGNPFGYLSRSAGLNGGIIRQISLEDNMIERPRKRIRGLRAIPICYCKNTRMSSLVRGLTCTLNSDDYFLEKVLNRDIPMKPPSLKKSIKAICTCYNFKESDMKSLSRARGVVGWFAVELGAGSLTEVAGYFGRDTATLRRIVGHID